MSRPTVIRALAAALLAAALGASMAAPAVAGPSAPQTAGRPAAMLDALQRDLGLRGADVATRLAGEGAAVATERAARTALGAAFAGAWFDAGSGALVVGTADPAGAAAVRAAGAEPRVVQRNGAKLESQRAELDRRAPRVPESVTGWFVEPSSNAVVVTATDPAAAEAYASGLDAVRVQQVAARPRPLAELVGGEVIRAVGGGQCSIGFNATGGGARYVITAGHCTDLGGDWNGVNGARIGPVAGSSFPNDDYGVIEVTAPGWTQSGTVSNFAGGRVRVTGSSEAVVGASTCRSGSTTGYRCGTVAAKDQTVNYGGGDVVFGLTRTTACAEPGDSGGPFISGTQAQGMTSGGYGDCVSGGETFFQPVDEALSAYGLSLVRG